MAPGQIDRSNGHDKVNLNRLQSFFSTNPSAKLMRSPHAAHILFFLDGAFKQCGRITWPHSLLLQRLTEFLETVHESEQDVLKNRPETYLSDWTAGDTRWLRRFTEAAHTEPAYELTSHTEEVLKFLREFLDRPIGFVGTESRLKRIIDALSDIAIRGSDDPSRRLEYLRAQRSEIEREIADIESGATVATYTPTAIRERFADAVSDLLNLQGDFRAVEESFKQITRDVQKRQSEFDGSRGEILGFALYAEDSLKSRDQGISFDEFVRLILSPNKQDELERIFERLAEIEVLLDQADGMQRVCGMIGSLSIEAQKVLGTTRRLSATLRRLLDSRALSARMRLGAVLREIRGAAARLAERSPHPGLGINVLCDIELANVFERTFWKAPARFEAIELTHEGADDDDRRAAFREFAEMRRLDWDAMNRNITTMLRESERVPLPALLKKFPPESGAVEVLAYMQIAQDGGHLIDPESTETIRLFGTNATLSETLLDAPRVVFVRNNLLESGELETS